MSAVKIETVRELVMDALSLHEDFEPEEVTDDGALFGDEGLGLDSLDALQLAVALEEKFSVTVDEGQGPEVFRSLRTITEHVNRKAG